MINKKDEADQYGKLYYEMLRIRLIEEEIAKRYPEGKMRCPTHLSIGQEGIPVVVCDSLTKEDLVVSPHRAHAHYLAKGGSLKKLIAELYGRKTGCTQGRGGSMNLSDLAAGFIASKAIIGNTIPVGVGLSLAQQLKKSNSITCIFLGDAAIEEGPFYESLNYAVLKRLPVLFICENNFYSVNTPLHLRQPTGRQIFELARGVGATSAQFDGSNITDYFDYIKSAIRAIRDDGGPYFIEFFTYRYKVHCGYEDDLDDKNRPQAEIDYWLAKDPVLLLKEFLLTNTCTSINELDIQQATIKSEINAAFDFAENSPFPEASERFLYRYGDTNADWLEEILKQDVTTQVVSPEASIV